MITRILVFTWVYSKVFLLTGICWESLWTLIAWVWFLTVVCSQVFIQITIVRESLETLITRIWYLTWVYPFYHNVFLSVSTNYHCLSRPQGIDNKEIVFLLSVVWCVSSNYNFPRKLSDKVSIKMAFSYASPWASVSFTYTNKLFFIVMARIRHFGSCIYISDK